jgi:natural product precursor
MSGSLVSGQITNKKFQKKIVMKTIDKLKLTQLSKVELEERQMNALRGGTNDDDSCNCNCSSGSTKDSTMSANAKYGYQYSYGGDGTYGGTQVCVCNVVEVPMASTRG